MSREKAKTVICVTGWHFNRPVYNQLAAVAEAEVFVVSHRPEAETPDYVIDLLGRDHIVFEANYGYDWGCYQQFYSSGIWKRFDYIIFMHDDVVIKDVDFVAACREALNRFPVVGNSRGENRTWKPGDLYGYFAHASFKPPTPWFQNDGVRGSFFAMKRATLEKLEKFEVFWDPLHLTPGLGNYSAAASCARMMSVCGRSCFTFLSDVYCESDYISELERGGQDPNAPETIWWKRKLIGWTVRLTGWYMSVYWGKRSARRRLALAMMEPFVALVSGRRLNRRWPSPTGSISGRGRSAGDSTPR